MTDTDRQDETGPPEPGAPVPPTPPPHQPPASREQDPSVSDDRFLLIAEKFVGTAMIFIGFIDIVISISSGAELAGVFPVLLYFGGLAVWAHATVRNPTTRYVVVGASLLCALAFMHYGEVLFWHKQLIFWGTVALVVFFMFKSAPKPGEGPDDRGGRHPGAE